MKLPEFEQYLNLNYDKATTRKSYFENVKHFVSFLEKNNLTLNQEGVNKYFIEAINNNTANGTINKKIKILKIYFKFLHLDLELPKSRKLNKNKLEFITEDEMLNEIIPLFDMFFYLPERKALWLKFLFYTGLRLNEMVNLDRSDVDFEKKSIIVRNTKGKKDREIMLLPEIKSDLINYFAEEEQETNCFNITESTIRNMFNQINKNIRFRIKLHSHLLRHSHAKYMVKRGIKVPDLQKTMGHADMKTTQIYAETDNDTALKNIWEVLEKGK